MCMCIVVVCWVGVGGEVGGVCAQRGAKVTLGSRVEMRNDAAVNRYRGPHQQSLDTQEASTPDTKDNIHSQLEVGKTSLKDFYILSWIKLNQVSCNQHFYESAIIL